MSKTLCDASEARLPEMISGENEMNPATDTIYAGVARIGMDVNSFHLGDGLILSKSFGHFVAPFFLTSIGNDKRASNLRSSSQASAPSSCEPTLTWSSVRTVPAVNFGNGRQSGNTTPS